MLNFFYLHSLDIPMGGLSVTVLMPVERKIGSKPQKL